LSNISTSDVGTREYTNTINYTHLADSITSPHRQFGTNMAKNKVALFLCAIYNYASSSSTMVKLSVTTGVVSLDQFFIKVIFIANEGHCIPNV
jgi:hypothetical protein